MCDMDEAEQAEYLLWVEAQAVRARVRPRALSGEKPPKELVRIPAEPLPAAA
jgi:hypothetical protein